jgi:hypothetical protein
MKRFCCLRNDSLGGFNWGVWERRGTTIFLVATFYGDRSATYAREHVKRLNEEQPKKQK